MRAPGLLLVLSVVAWSAVAPARAQGSSSGGEAPAEDIPLDAPYESAFGDDDPGAPGGDAPGGEGPAEDIPLDAPYESAFGDAEGGEGEGPAEDIPLDAPYESAFGDEEPTPPARPPQKPPEVAKAEDGTELELEGILLENRTYFREATARGFLETQAPGPLIPALLERDRDVLQGKYKSRGYLQATVKLDIRPGKNPYGRVAALVIDAGERAPLNAVHILGNVRVTDEELRTGFFSRGPEPLGLLTRAAFYHKPFVDQDTQRLLANYYQRGFLEARVVETRLVATPDLEALELTFVVVEGAQYELISLSLSGDLPERQTPEQLRRRISVRDGQVADLITIQQDADLILNDLREVGYPFARVEQQVELGPAPSGDPERRGIGLKLALRKGEKAKVGKIRVSGNQGLLYGTLDRVILRDVVMDEGDEYRHSELEESRLRLMGLGYFSAVEVRPVPTEDPKVVDIEVKVVEQPTWLLNLAPAFVANEGFILIGIAADRHVLGSGISASLVGTLSFQRQVFDLNVTEPRLFDTPVSVTGELHRRLIAYPDFNQTSEFGGGARLRFPIAPIRWGLYLGGSLTSEFGGVQNYNFEGYRGPVVPENDLFPQKVFRNVIDFTATWDRRDSLLSPRNGVLATATVAYAGRYSGSGFGLPHREIGNFLPGVDLGAITASSASKLDFVKAEANLRLFFTPFWNLTFKTNTRAGFAFNPHGGEVPATDRFFLGGFGSIRGYFPRSIGPTRSDAKTDGQPVRIGGVKMFSQNTEVEFPLWPETPFRGFLFLDAGNTFDDAERFLPIDLADPLGGILGAGLDRGTPILPLGLFWSVGFGVLIQTPVFPLRFEWSVPLTRRSFEERRPIDFFFGVGSAF